MPPPLTASKKTLLLEFLILFVVLPIIYWLDWVPVHKIVPLLLMFGYCVVQLVRYRKITKNSFHLAADWKTIGLRFLIIAGLMALVMIVFLQVPLFADLRENKKLMIMVLLYPVTSAFPQELIFRRFFFFRYESLFPNRQILLIMNVLLFSFAHIYFSSWVVLAFTLVGGLIFALTFFKSRSLLVVSVEHSLYGLLILCSGLSVHFYKAF